MLTKKYGKGAGKSFETALLGVSAELQQEHKNITFTEFCDALAKQFNIKDGVMIIKSIEFNYKKAKGDE